MTVSQHRWGYSQRSRGPALERDDEFRAADAGGEHDRVAWIDDGVRGALQHQRLGSDPALTSCADVGGAGHHLLPFALRVVGRLLR